MNYTYADMIADIIGNTLNALLIVGLLYIAIVEKDAAISVDKVYTTVEGGDLRVLENGKNSDFITFIANDRVIGMIENSDFITFIANDRVIGMIENSDFITFIANDVRKK